MLQAVYLPPEFSQRLYLSRIIWGRLARAQRYALLARVFRKMEKEVSRERLLERASQEFVDLSRAIKECIYSFVDTQTGAIPEVYLKTARLVVFRRVNVKPRYFLAVQNAWNDESVGARRRVFTLIARENRLVQQLLEENPEISPECSFEELPLSLRKIIVSSIDLVSGE